jgi:hypothetical protein
VVAPSLIPKKPGDRVKTNRRDAVSLAKLSVPLAANHAPLPVAIPFLDRHLQPQLDQPQHRAVRDATRHRFKEVVMRNRIEVPG